jgi:hypothetical protein
MAEEAGVSEGTITHRMNQINPDQMPRSHWLKLDGDTRITEYFERTWADPFIEKIRPKKLMPWQVTVEMMGEYFNVKKQTLGKALRTRGIKAQQINVEGMGKLGTYPFSTIMQLQSQGYTPTNSAPPIDETLIVNSVEAARDNPAAIMYMQS